MNVSGMGHAPMGTLGFFINTSTNHSVSSQCNSSSRKKKKNLLAKMQHSVKNVLQCVLLTKRRELSSVSICARASVFERVHTCARVCVLEYNCYMFRVN